ncbi:unnamed protein product [Rangifer tarandus platyrhynchus]|uniref:Uncharacterized protein n=1 Tax=Rangifer tarandus platyrhynchus TaxID=3082113 RepID=A0ABN8ZGL7_RANTA|nr:unnamed protein product [Rangifer tarandus platyrhynchus]
MPLLPRHEEVRGARAHEAVVPAAAVHCPPPVLVRRLQSYLNLRALRLLQRLEDAVGQVPALGAALEAMLAVLGPRAASPVPNTRSPPPLPPWAFSWPRCWGSLCGASTSSRMRLTWASWHLGARPERRAHGPARGPLPGRLHLSSSLSASLCPPTVSVSLFSLYASPSFSLWVLLVSLYDFPYLSCPCFPIAPVCLSECLSVFPSLVSSGPPGNLCICPPHLKEGTPVTLFASVLLSVVSWPGTCLLALWWKGSS